MVPEVGVAFLLLGENISPEQVTNRVGLQPTRAWRRGDSVQETLLKRREDGWLLGLPRKNTIEFEEELCALLDKIEPQRNAIAEACKNLNLKSLISCVVYVSDETPILGLSNETMNRMASLGADFDLDLILTK